jgi:UDP-glucose 4-epimerase
MTTKKTVLITGGFGFLGGRLGQHLSNNFSVILASRADHVIPKWLPSSKTLKIDWESEQSLLDACSSVDIIIHAAGLNAQDCDSDPERALLVNGFHTQNLVNAAINQGVKKFFYLSTIHVYSENLGSISEDSPLLNSHPYATSHVAGENAVLFATSQGFIEGTVVRIANVFGSPVSRGVNCWMLIVNDLCKQSVVNKSLRIHSNIEVARNFITITDFCFAIEFLIANQNIDKVVNIGSSKSITISEMAKKVQSIYYDILGFKPPILSSIKLSKGIEPINLKTNYLNKVNFKLENDFNLEIRKLISFCVKNFSHEPK